MGSIPVSEPFVLAVNKNVLNTVLHDWCNIGRGMCYPVCGMHKMKTLGWSVPLNFINNIGLITAESRHSRRCSTTGVAKAMVCAVLSVT